MDTTEWIKELCPEIADWQVELIAGEYQALREANEAFAKRQEWWDRKMFQLEQQLEEAVPHLRLRNFADDWDAPGMEAYDDL